MTYEPMPVPTPKASRTTRTVLIVVAVVLALCCLCGVGGGTWLYRTYNNAAGPAREATTAYLDDLMAANYDGAYGRLCQKSRDAVTRADFTRVQSAQLKIRSYEVTGVYVANYNGKVRAEVTVRYIQDTTGAQATQVLPLVKEGGQWRPCQ
ncbi:hypothetical protein V6V47_22075 [Micromonospora sp. CPCC 205539]|uniref:Rv0361 family membrane protein n=1 Tax=Micromonospora sp. CPCC 205539 TaxID=3122408 RepID=UPI002FEFA5E0